MTEAAYLQRESERAAARLRAVVSDHPVVALTAAAAGGLLGLWLLRRTGPAALLGALRPILRAYFSR